MVCQGKFSPRFWVCFGAFSAGIRRIFGVEVARMRFQELGEAREAFLTLIRTHRLLRRVFLIFTTGGKRGPYAHSQSGNNVPCHILFLWTSETFISSIEYICYCP
jgi:hypothetical protein